MDDFSFFDGSDYDFSGDDYGSAPWDVPDYGGDNYGGAFDDFSDTGYPGIGYGSDDYSGYDPGSLFGSGSSSSNTPSSGSGFNWGQLINWGLGAAQGYAQNAAQEKLSDKQYKQKLDFMRQQMAEEEKYYQLHGKQLSDALGNYAQFQKPAADRPFSSLANVQSPFNNNVVQAPFTPVGPPQGLLAYGY